MSVNENTALRRGKIPHSSTDVSDIAFSVADDAKDPSEPCEQQQKTNFID